MTPRTEKAKRPKTRVLAPGTLAALLITISFLHQAHAAAKAPDVDPSRYSIGNIVYPPGVKPTPKTETLQNGEVVKDQTSSSVTIQSKSKVRAKHKSAE